MLRYRITHDPQGRHVVLPAVTSAVSIHDTYATRAEAQNAASWLKRSSEGRQKAEA